MSLLNGVSAFFGLDIGSSALRVVELHGNGAQKVLYKYAYMPIDNKISLSDSRNDQQRLSQAILQLVTQAKLSTKNVAVGIPSDRVFTTVADVDRLPAHELEKSIRYQADALIPTPLNESKIDWALLGDSPVDKTKVEILLTSVPNDFVERRLDIVESAGLTAAARADAVFAGLPRDLLTFQWHGETFDLPAGATLLASSAAYSMQAFRWQDKAYGIQFHLEVSTPAVELWAKEQGYQEGLERSLGEGAATRLASALDEHQKALLTYGRVTFENWLKTCGLAG